MAYRFKLKEELRAGVRRIAVEQIEKVSERPRSADQRAVWVHETRKALKRTRALLRCVRSGLADATWSEENAALREIARKLSGLRDRHVAQATIDGLRDRDETLDGALDWLAGALAQPTPASPAGAARSSDATISWALTSLAKARRRLARLDVAGEFTVVVADGLARCQAKGRKAVEHLAGDPTDEALHELRKSVQIYQRQQALVQLAWPEVQSVRIEAARAVAETLGAAQDLAVLARMAAEHGQEDAGAAVHAARIVAACRRRQEELRSRALPLARRLFALRPRAVRAELETAWTAALALAKGAADVPSSDSRTKRQRKRAAAGLG